MPSYKRPGVYVEEMLSVSTAFGDVSLQAAVFVAVHGRGPTTPSKSTSWADFTTKFGAFGNTAQYLPHAMYHFFNNGGRDAYVLRVPGNGSVIATSGNILDTADPAVATLKIDALNEGTWGNGVSYEIRDGSGPGLFTLLIRIGGNADSFIAERWVDLSMNQAHSRYVLNIVNSFSSGSRYVKVIDLSSASVAPTNAPVATASTALTGGENGTNPTQADIINALPLLDLISEPFSLNIPGAAGTAQASDSSINSAALAYAAARGDVFVVVDPPMGSSAEEVASYSESLPAMSYGAIYDQWVYVSDPASTAPGGTRLVPAGGAILGQYAATDTRRGIHKAPAGIGNRLAGVVGLERRRTSAELDLLNEAHVNSIRQIPGSGIVLWGARTLAKGRIDKYIPVRRTLIYLKRALLDGTQFAVFEPNSESLWLTLEETISQFLRGFWQAGGLRGNTPGEAFYVIVDDTNNTPDVIDAGEVRVEVGVALQAPAEFVVIRIGHWDGGRIATDTFGT